MIEKKSILILPGNNYRLADINPFINYLKKQSWVREVKFIQLLENIYMNLSYDVLTPVNYSKYIYDQIPDKTRKYIVYGCSMGCYHIQNFSHFYPNVIESIVLLEPTMCGGVKDILKKFECGRGNRQFIEELIGSPEIQSLPASEKVIDLAVSDDIDYWFPQDVKLGIIYTSRNAQGYDYNKAQIDAKDQFLKELNIRQYNYKFIYMEGPHAADTSSLFFDKITNFIYAVTFL